MDESTPAQHTEVSGPTTKLMLVNGEKCFHTGLHEATEDVDVEILRVNNRTSDPAVAAQQIAAREPDVVLVGADHGVEEALSIIEALDRAMPGAAPILIAPPAAETWQRALRAGARDLLAPDVEVQEIAEALERVVSLRAQQPLIDLTPSGTATTPDAGRVVTIVSPKGGCGKTMLATNLAYGLQKHDKGSVVVVDFDLQFGDIAAALGLRPEYTVSNAIRAADDATTTKSYLTAHQSGLFALCAPGNPAEADNFEPDNLGQLLFTLQAEFDWVIVDTSAGISEATLVAIEAATDVMLVATTDLAAIQALRKSVMVLDQIGLTSHRRWHVLNRSNARVGLDQADIEKSLGIAIDANIPSARAVPIAMNQGLPVMEDDARSPAARAIDQLVAHVAPTRSQSEPGTRRWLQRIRT